VIGVNLSEPPERVKAYAAEMGLTFPIVIDTSGEVARAWGVRFTPTHFLIDRWGVVRAGGSGSRDWNGAAAHAAVRLLMEWVAVEQSSVPARQDAGRMPSQTGRNERR